MKNKKTAMMRTNESRGEALTLRLSKHYVDRVFAADGILARAWPGYAPREGQIRMADEVDWAYQHSERAVVEAECGTGKSFAYLVPAIFHAANPPDGKRGKRTIVVTANKSLQAQLIRDDLPTLQEILPWKFTFANAKGRSNYLCQSEYENNAEQIEESCTNSDAVHRWVHETEIGDLDELERLMEVDYKTRRRLTVTSEECRGSRCVFHRSTKEHEDRVQGSYGWCFVQQLRERLHSIDIIVANYHLLFAHLKVLQVTGGGAALLPPFDAVICDEAHKLADVARDFFGDKVGYHAVHRAVTPLARKGTYRNFAHRAFKAIAAYKAKQANSSRDPNLVYLQPLAKELMDPVVRVLDDARDEAESTKKATALERIEKVRDRFLALAQAQAEGSVHFIDDEGALCRKLVNVGPSLDTLLWGTTGTSVLTSATLSTGGDKQMRFEFIQHDTGIGSNAATLRVSSPFDYSRCVLYVADDIPAPTEREEWREEAPRRLWQLCERNGGRALLLFTSVEMMERAYESFVKRVAPFRLLIQREGTSRKQLIEEKKRDPTSVLFGVESFWAGVDLRGPCCTLVVMDKIPFPVPSDPVQEALASIYGKDYFFRQSLPRAVTQFKQGAGRLMRSVDDFGVIATLDNRLVNARYGRMLRESLPRGIEATIDERRILSLLEKNRRRLDGR